jgi:hypothetical protein
MEVNEHHCQAIQLLSERAGTFNEGGNWVVKMMVMDHQQQNPWEKIPDS